MEQREPELIDYLAVLWRRRWLVVAGTLAGLLVAGLLTWLQPRIYRVVATIETGDVSDQEAERVAARLNLGSFMNSEEARRAAAQGGGRLVAEYRKPLMVQLSVETAAPLAAGEHVTRAAGWAVEELNRVLAAQFAETETNVSTARVEIERLQALRSLRERRADGLRRSLEHLQKARVDASRRVDDPVTALIVARLWDEISNKEYALVEVERELDAEFPRKIQELNRQIELATRKLAAIRRPRVVAPPEVPQIPVRPRPKLNAAVGFAVGLLGSVLLALFAEYVRVSRPRRVESTT
jgi:Chain length determinant protein